jgi:hypothetical protein
LPETGPRGAPDLEQNTDGQEHPGRGYLPSVPSSSLSLPSRPRTRLNRWKTSLTITEIGDQLQALGEQLQALKQQKARVIMQEITFWTNLFSKRIRSQVHLYHEDGPKAKLTWRSQVITLSLFLIRKESA